MLCLSVTLTDSLTCWYSHHAYSPSCSWAGPIFAWTKRIQWKYAVMVLDLTLRSTSLLLSCVFGRVRCHERSLTTPLKGQSEWRDNVRSLLRSQGEREKLSHARILLEPSTVNLLAKFSYLWLWGWLTAEPPTEHCLSLSHMIPVKASKVCSGLLYSNR